MKRVFLDGINNICKNSLIEHLGIVFTDVSEEMIKATMPVDNRTKQPMGLLHGGATMALVETVGSVGSYVIVDHEKYDVVGMEINGNHIGNTFGEYVYAVGTLLHKGKRTHVWGVNVYDDSDKIISICRITNMILKKTDK